MSKERREFESLARFVSELVTEREPMLRVGTTLRALSRLFEGASATLLLKEGEGALRVVASHDESGRGEIIGAAIPLKNSLTGRAISLEKPVEYCAVDLPSDYVALADAMQSELAMPLQWQQQLVGVLSIESTERNAFDDDYDRSLAPYVAALSAAVGDLLGARQQSQPYEMIRGMRERQVLVLGKDTSPEDIVLLKVASGLRAQGYVPLLVKTFPDFRELSNEDKVRVFADVSRFVIIENSFPAGQIVECKICAVNRIVTAMLRQRGRGSSYMVTDYDKDYEFMREFEYVAADEDLAETLRQATTWAEQQVQARAEFFDKRYPWRVRHGSAPNPL
jgi:hypothetical protein